MELEAGDETAGLGESSRKRLATAMLCTRRERRREEEGPEAGVLEPDEDDSEGEGAVSCREGRGRGSGGSETLSPTGMLMTIILGDSE